LHCFHAFDETLVNLKIFTGEKMKTLKISVMLAVAITAVCSGTLRAELTGKQIADGFHWAYDSRDGLYVSELRLYNSSGTNPNITNAYSSILGPTGVYTMCVGNGSAAPYGGTATLNYESGTGYTRSNNGDYLSVGAAVLYQRYAAGELNYDYVGSLGIGTRYTDANNLRSAIFALNRAASMTASEWTNNQYALYLLRDVSGFSLAEINANTAAVQAAKAYWTSNYSTDQYYAELGNYAVFMMDIGNGTTYQTQLYVTGANYNNPGAPEPATLLLWTLGSIGALGFRHSHKRSRKA